MPKFNDMQTVQLPGAGNFQFSAIRPAALGATEYTLVTIVVDITASVEAYRKELLETIKSVIKACQRHPRADNLMARLVLFNTKRTEIHGFVPLSQIDPADYKPLKCSGSTALYDAVYDAVAATNAYAQTLFSQDFDVNAAIYIITDGEDNASGVKPAEIADQVKQAAAREFLQSLVTVLVGINTMSVNAAAYLRLFKDEAKISQYVDVAQADATGLAKLAQFVSKSISLQSQSLGTRGAALSF
jgi:uncharacterized protein YegL